jgi:RND family efflux transporter MFP subunit
VATPTEEVITDYEECTGRTMALKTVDIRARVSGYLDAVHFVDGAHVKEGDLLIQIDDRPYKAEFERTSAAAQQAKSHLERLERQEERARKLLPSKTISIEDYEAIQFDRVESQAALGIANAARDIAELNLNFTKIKSPITGQISRRLVDPGNLIKADDTSLANIVSLNPIYAYFAIDERTVLHLRRLIQDGRMKSADETAIHVQAALADEDKYTLSGTINFVDNQIEATTGTLIIRAVIENPREMLSPGMFVRLRIPVGEPRKALVLPEEALSSDQGSRFIYVLNANDEVVYRRVQVGTLAAGRRVIESGVEPDERVIVNGLQRVRPGVKVAPKPVESETAVADATAAKAESKPEAVKPAAEEAAKPAEQQPKSDKHAATK